MKKVVLKIVALLLLIVPTIGVLTACGEKTGGENLGGEGIVGRYTVYQVDSIVNNETTTMTIDEFNELLAKQNPSAQDQELINKFTNSFTAGIIINEDNTALVKIGTSEDNCFWSLEGDLLKIVPKDGVNENDYVTLKIKDNKLVWTITNWNSSTIITFSK